MDFPQPTHEHEMLTSLVGDWTYEGKMATDPDGPPAIGTGTERIRKVGELWIVCEWSGTIPGCDEPMTSMTTLGFDVAKKRFVGSFIASLMPNIWQYTGALDSAARTIILDCEGPSFTDPNVMAMYQDHIRLIDNDHRTLTSHVQNTSGDGNGSWTEFMKMTFTRSK